MPGAGVRAAEAATDGHGALGALESLLLLNLIGGKISARADLGNVSLHNEVNRSVFAFLSWKQSDLVGGVRLEPRHRRVERDKLLLLLHEIFKVIL